ncbi:hypothetical protein GGX14DRAFT_374143, partial [Mycena pura]
WGKISFLGGGDKIWGAEVVNISEGNMTRDASFIKYSCEVDLNARHRNRPVVLQRRVAYGQLLRVVEFFVDLPVVSANGKITQKPRDVLLAVIRPVKPTEQNTLRMPYYQDGKFAPLEVVDVSCLVARVPDHGPGPRKWALCAPRPNTNYIPIGYIMW